MKWVEKNIFYVRSAGEGIKEFIGDACLVYGAISDFDGFLSNRRRNRLRGLLLNGGLS